jgi:hypothetical protein
LLTPSLTYIERLFDLTLHMLPGKKSSITIVNEMGEESRESLTYNRAS